MVFQIFAPNRLLKQLLLAVALQGGVFVLQWIGNIGQYVLALCTSKGRKMLTLRQQMGCAKTYQEWRRIAEEIDVLTGTE